MQGGTMIFPKEYYTPDMLDLMTWAFDAAWEDVEFALAKTDANPSALRTLMAVRIMTAVRDGERDPERLKELALEAVAKGS